MLTVLQLIAILTLGYLSAHFLIGKLQTKFFVASGLEFIVLGILIGPTVTNIMTPEVVNQLDPFISISIGSLGLFYGLRMRIRDLAKVETAAYHLLFAETLLTFTLVAAVFGLIFWYGTLGEVDRTAALTGALVLGATAAVSAPTAIRAVKRRYHAKGPVTELLHFVVRFDQTLGITMFGMIFCLFHVGQTHGIRPLTEIEWLAVNLGLGIVLGLLFYLFLGKEEKQNTLLLGLLGVVVFSSGAAHYLNLSPIFINFVLGFMLANTSKIRVRLMDLIRSIERPFYAVVLVFAGAAWHWPDLIGRWPFYVLLIITYLVLRYAGMYWAGVLTFMTSEQPERLTRRIGMGLLSQGGVAVAMLVNYQQVYENQYTPIVAACVLISVIFYEFVSLSRIREVLVDVNELQLRAAEKNDAENNRPVAATKAVATPVHHGP